MQPTPIPPVVPLPPTVRIPGPSLSMPAPQVPLWEPVPIYRDDIPGLDPEPTPEPTPEPEPSPEPETPPPPTEKEILDAVGDMITPTPVVPPWDPPVMDPVEPIEPESTMETIEVPFTDLEVPVPPQEIMVTAVTTAGAAAIVSVGATMAAGKLFEQIVKIAKPIFKFVFKKLAKIRGKDPGPTWARARLLEPRQHKRSRKAMKDGS